MFMFMYVDGYALYYSDMIEHCQCATRVHAYIHELLIFSYNTRCNLFYKLVLILLNQHYQIHNSNSFREKLIVILVLILTT